MQSSSSIDQKYRSLGINLGTIAKARPSDHITHFSNGSLHGFIDHPERFPLSFRRLRFWEYSKIDDSQTSNIGLTFSSLKYQKPGNILEVTIPIQRETYQFLGKIVMVKALEETYKIGIWLLNSEDSSKLRIIEQICHIELYLRDKQHKEAPCLSREKLIAEWVNHFASCFPAN